jgi:hypothetical protein
MVSRVARTLKKACFRIYAGKAAMRACCVTVGGRNSSVFFVANIVSRGDAVCSRWRLEAASSRMRAEDEDAEGTSAE